MDEEMGDVKMRKRKEEETRGWAREELMTGSERGTKGSWERGGQRREEDATEEGVLHTRREMVALQLCSLSPPEEGNALARWRTGTASPLRSAD